MTVKFALIFIFSLMLGFGYAWINGMPVFQTIIAIVVGGFFGSCLVAVLFTYSYFTHEETNEDKISKLKQEIKLYKKET